MWVWVVLVGKVWETGGKNVEKNSVGGNCGKNVKNNKMKNVKKL
jgi:hypothetical protein